MSRREKRERRSHEVQRNRQARARNLLKELGVWEELKQAGFAESIIAHSYFSPLDVVLVNATSDARAERIRKELEHALSEATFACPLLGDYSVQEYLKHVMPIQIQLWMIQGEGSAPYSLRQKLALLAPFVEEHSSDDVLDGLYDRFLEPILLKHSRLDECLYHLKWELRREPRKKVLHQLVLKPVPSEWRTVSVDGESRRTFRCGRAEWGTEDVIWASWRGSLLGGPGNVHLPVYVQRHAVRALHERLSPLITTERFQGTFDTLLYSSLAEPRLQPSPANNGSYLVDFVIGGSKAGYFVAAPVDGIILIKTFLFLTMDGTPEGLQLRKQLRLSRDDKKHLGLDSLSTFLDTDIADDLEVRFALEQCGCIGLLKLRDLERTESYTKGVADSVQAYLRPEHSKRQSVLDIIKGGN